MYISDFREIISIKFINLKFKNDLLRCKKSTD